MLGRCSRPASARQPVRIYLGPVLLLGGLHHLHGRLEGLLKYFSQAGLRNVEIIDVSDYRRLWIEVYETCVWTADPADLCWAGDGIDDPLCAEALTNVFAAL